MQRQLSELVMIEPNTACRDSEIGEQSDEHDELLSINASSSSNVAFIAPYANHTEKETLMDLMALLQQALEASGKLRDLSKKVEDADFKMVLAELHGALADAKLESGELKMKLAASQEQVAALRAQVDQRVRTKPTYTPEGVYSFEGEVGRFCTACWDSDERRVRLTDLALAFRFAGQWECPKCHAGYGAKN